MLVYWEMTNACGLACKHCRAEATPSANPFELNTEESKTFLRQLVDFGAPLPHLILTGGDPLRRPDLFQLIDFELFPLIVTYTAEEYAALLNTFSPTLALPQADRLSFLQEIQQVVNQNLGAGEVYADLTAGFTPSLITAYT